MLEFQDRCFELCSICSSTSCRREPKNGFFCKMHGPWRFATCELGTTPRRSGTPSALQTLGLPAGSKSSTDFASGSSLWGKVRPTDPNWWNAQGMPPGSSAMPTSLRPPKALLSSLRSWFTRSGRAPTTPSPSSLGSQQGSHTPSSPPSTPQASLGQANRGGRSRRSTRSRDWKHTSQGGSPGGQPPGKKSAQGSPPRGREARSTEGSFLNRALNLYRQASLTPAEQPRVSREQIADPEPSWGYWTTTSQAKSGSTAGTFMSWTTCPPWQRGTPILQCPSGQSHVAKRGQKRKLDPVLARGRVARFRAFQTCVTVMLASHGMHVHAQNLFETCLCTTAKWQRKEGRFYIWVLVTYSDLIENRFFSKYFNVLKLRKYK